MQLELVVHMFVNGAEINQIITFCLELFQIVECFYFSSNATFQLFHYLGIIGISIDL